MVMAKSYYQYSKLVLFEVTILFFLNSASQTLAHNKFHGVQPLSKIDILSTSLALHPKASVKASPSLLGVKSISDTEWVTVQLESPNPSSDDWVGVFSPAKFKYSSSPAPFDSLMSSDYYSKTFPRDVSAVQKDTIQWNLGSSSASANCEEVGNKRVQTPFICTAPIKYKYANHSSADYAKTGKATLKFQMINQRADFSFALFSGGLSSPKLVAVSKPISFANPKAPLYPRLALGETWDVMTVTWTSGYDIDEAVPFVEWGLPNADTMRSPAGTTTYTRNQMCAAPARTVGWRDPGFIHTSFLKGLWPNTIYSYRMGHLLPDGSYVWSKKYKFKSPPVPGQNSLQRVVIFGDMGKAERDGSNEYADYQPGSLNTTDQLVKDINNIDAVFLIGDMPYANGYVSQWDQYTAQVEPIASAVPFMVASGNHERDSPNSGSFYDTDDSGGECGVPAETTFYVPAKNRAKFWYSADYGMFHFCIADTEHDWRAGTEQYKFLEECLASANRHKQPWLIFAGHRPLGYSSNSWLAQEGSFSEPMGRDDLQKLWQKYKVDIAFWGHVHSYERTCPIYQNQCVNKEKSHYSGVVNGTIHVVAGGGGSHLSAFTPLQTPWSIYKDYDFGFVKLTAYNYSSLLFEYKKSNDGNVHDSFTISRDYKDVLACVHDGCEATTLAT